MDVPQFVAAYITKVYDSAIESTVSDLEKPVERWPSAARLAASAWYRDLPEEKRRLLVQVIAQAVHAACFNTFAVIDGEAHIGPWRFELVAVDRDGARHLVNPSHGEDFLDNFQATTLQADLTTRRPGLTGDIPQR